MFIQIIINIWFIFQPHEVPEKWKSAIPTPRSYTKSLEESTNKQISNNPTSTNATNAGSTSTQAQNNASGIKKPSLKIKSREKLETTLIRLLALLPNAKEPLDASNLLESEKRPKRCSRVGLKHENTENHW